MSPKQKRPRGPRALPAPPVQQLKEAEADFRRAVKTAGRLDESDDDDIPAGDRAALLRAAAAILDRERAVNETEDELSARESKAGDRGRELDERQNELDSREAAHGEQVKELRDEREGLEEQRRDAVNGFREALAPHEERRKRLLADVEELEARLEATSDREDEARLEAARVRLEARVRDYAERGKRELEALATTSDERLAELEEVFRNRLAALAQERGKIAEERAEAQLEHTRVTGRLRQVEAREERFETAVEEEVQRRLADDREERERLAGALSTERDRLAEARDRVAALEASAAKQGDRSIESVLAENDELHERVRALEAAASQQLSERERDELRALHREEVKWREQEVSLKREIDRERSKAEAWRREIEAVEALREEVRRKEALLDRLKRDIAHYEEILGLAVDAERTRSPYVTFVEHDEDPGRTEGGRVPMRDRLPSLAELAEEIRHRMASLERPRYYEARDVRIFLAGLAASRIHILEGMSGTGKTSLPLAFAAAVGAEAPVVEVQAGWRDRMDLMGQYNAFERRFYETKFSTALYDALLPDQRDRLVFVVLDEMNLSHPEQYFQDVNSSIERDEPHERALQLAAGIPLPEGSAVLPPAWAQRDHLPIGANVWFIGTANNDETTTTFADKTYDRAHVMVLPPRHTEFNAHRQEPGPAIAHDDLARAFQAATARRADEARRIWEEVLHNALLVEALEHVQVGTGNRLLRQVESFVPVLLEAGGDAAEAADHLLSTKVVRKLRGRLDLRDRDLRPIAEALALTVDGWDNAPRTHLAFREILRQLEIEEDRVFE